MSVTLAGGGKVGPEYHGVAASQEDIVGMYLNAKMGLTFAVKPCPTMQRITRQTIHYTFDCFGKYGIRGIDHGYVSLGRQPGCKSAVSMARTAGSAKDRVSGRYVQYAYVGIGSG
jgi:hypothetical protein